MMLALAFCAAAGAAAPPHIALILADDYGWANIGYHNVNNSEVQTPVLDRLASEGVTLDRHYAYKFCSPTRSSLQSGRLPVHVNTVNADAAAHNPADPVGGYAGIPVNMTTLAQKLAAGGYATYMTGKWDAGMATPRHTPLGRGYRKWLGYFHHANDYWTAKLPLLASGLDVCFNAYRDLWQDAAPAAAVPLDGSVYEEEYFLNHSLAVIRGHNATVDGPMFLFHSFHLVHVPLEVPQSYLAQFEFVKGSPRQRRPYAAMTKLMDDHVGALVGALKEAGMYDTTLIVFLSDNGGPIYYPCGANNHPLKGGKESDWEGGVRVNAFVSGGYVPPAARGRVHDGYIHVADWYTTLAGLAGVPADDPEAAAAGLPGVDGVDVWGDIVGASANARRSIHLSECAYIEDEYKLVMCEQTQAGWTAAVYPVEGHPQPMYKAVPFDQWKEDCTAGCLYDIRADPNERRDLAAARPDVLRRMRAALAALNAGNYSPDRGGGSRAACAYAKHKYSGFYGPFVDVPEE
eukprot:TRINITY_DN1703_c0_g2_i1.p1 TRINITY_DN1703_c0_g2~~TRINITY_DN1703_c0_g2_i1.p1  ORF type:complete len:517 (+),score=164.14 TRINITY_DN1703_c0_g2_i1:37-1587(+)